MRIKTIQIENFKRLSGKRVYDLQDGITTLTGLNGSGKSTLASAIAWALYGPDVLPTGKADVITWGTNRAFVRVTIEFDDRTYNIERLQEKSGRSDAELVLLSDDPAYPPQFLTRGVDPTNREVVKLLGVDRVGFLVSVYARQEELAGLMSLTPANRKKTVLRLLGIDHLTGAIDDVKTRAREARKVLDGLLAGQSSSIPDIEEHIVYLNDQIDGLNQLVGEEQDRLSEITKEHEHLVQQATRLIPLRHKYEQYREQRGKAEIAYRVSEAELRAAEKDAARLVPPMEPGEGPQAIDRKYVEIKEREAVGNQKAIDELAQRIAYMERTSICETCHRPFDNTDDLQEQVAILQSDLDQRIMQFDIDDEELTSLRADLEVYEEYLQTVKDYEYDLESFQWATEAVERAKADVEGYRVALDAIEPVEDASEALDALRERLAESAAAAAKVRESLSTLAERKANYLDRLESLEQDLINVQKVQDKIASVQSEMLNHDVTALELSNLKDMLIGQVIPTIQVHASRLLAEFTDGRYTELFLTPDYEVQFLNNLGELKNFSNLSGGEQDVFALALRLAIANLRADNIGLLILDEVVESLDPERQDATWQALERLTTHFDQILFITHVPSFKDRAAQVINLN